MRGTLTGQCYVDDILRPHVGPFLNGLPGAIFQQDNARPHTARVAQDFYVIFRLFHGWPAPPICPLWSTLITCLGGCELELMDIMGTRPILPSRNSNTESSSVSRNARSDSGYESANHGLSRTNSNFSSGSARSQSATNNFLSRSNSNPSSGSSQSQSASNNTFSRSNNTLESTTTNSRQMSTNHPMTRNPFRPVSTANNRFDSSNDIVCNCGKKAIVLVVKKDGPTKGRQFYKCPEMSEGTKCDFFLWKNENSSDPQVNNLSWPQNNFSSRFNSDSIQNENSENGILCRCNLTAKIMIVRKEGPTKGRQFYTCPKGRDEGCKFFKWADEDSSNRDASSNLGTIQLTFAEMSFLTLADGAKYSLSSRGKSQLQVSTLRSQIPTALVER
ncbi:DNA topoisomerase 3-alpha [Trichonephila clavipes]|nr:DNA topoisomerase 3-alpha [Trichonephila clavipes]